VSKEVSKSDCGKYLGETENKSQRANSLCGSVEMWLGSAQASWTVTVWTWHAHCGGSQTGRTIDDIDFRFSAAVSLKHNIITVALAYICVAWWHNG